MKRQGRKKRKKLIINDIIIGVIVILIVIVGYKIASYYIDNAKSQEKIEDLKSMIFTESEMDSENNSNTKSDKSEKETKDPADRFKKLLEQNSDFIGWITIDDTMIDYPVMQNMTDNQYYLHRDFNRAYDYSGLIFADNRCTIEEPSTNIILYGHHMNSGTMFAGLLKYSDRAYCESHNTIEFDTIYGKRTYAIFAAFNAEIYDEKDTEHFKYYDFINVSDEQQYNDAMSYVKSMSYYKDDFPEYNTEILTLSTCGNGDEKSRFVVMAKRIKDKNKE